MKKTTNSSRKISALSFSRATRGDWRTIVSWRERGLKDKQKKALMEDYLEWVELPTSTDYVDFLNEHGIAHRTFQDWFFANEDLREVHDYVKERIGVRLQKKLFETNPEMVSKVIRKYHPVWGECWSEEIEAKTKEAEKGASNITVEMKKAADCPDVPPRPEGTD